MVDKTSEYYVPPLSPEAHPEGLYLQKNQTRRLGEKLYEHSSSFYSWYQWMRKGDDLSQTTPNLQVIMQIAQKALLTPQEEQEAISHLLNLGEGLGNGQIKSDQISYEITQIIDKLTENNPKSRVVMCATRIEIAINLSKKRPPNGLREGLNWLVRQVSRDMPKMQAERLSRELSPIVESTSSKEISELFRQSILPLLDKSQMEEA